LFPVVGNGMPNTGGLSGLGDGTPEQFRIPAEGLPPFTLPNDGGTLVIGPNDTEPDIPPGGLGDGTPEQFRIPAEGLPPFTLPNDGGALVNDTNDTNDTNNTNDTASLS
jgi:hypothetical protein